MKALVLSLIQTLSLFGLPPQQRCMCIDSQAFASIAEHFRAHLFIIPTLISSVAIQKLDVSTSVCKTYPLRYGQT